MEHSVWRRENSEKLKIPNVYTFGIFGPLWGIRTPDQRNRNPVLYPAELRTDAHINKDTECKYIIFLTLCKEKNQRLYEILSEKGERYSVGQERTGVGKGQTGDTGEEQGGEFSVLVVYCRHCGKAGKIE